MPGDIWLGDLVVAFAEVGSSDNERRRIAQMLGFELVSLLASPPPFREPLSTPGPDESASRASGARPTGPAIPATASSTREGVQSGSTNETPSRELRMLTPVAREPIAATGWGLSSSLQQVSAEHLTAVLDHEPLFAPRSAAATVAAAVATEIDDGPLDVEAIVAALARRQPLQRLPRKRRRSLRFGVQVLIDMGEAMQPFARDEQVLVDQVRRIVGVDRTSLLYFADCPVRGAGPGPRRTWRTYSPPKSGTRVLVVSNFGIGGPALYIERSQEKEWRAFVMGVRRAACTVIGLVPYPPGRWPHQLATLLPLVTWDRSTTVARVSAARAGG
jgi:hypothetical protein